ncbi:MAG: hypothetical protein MRY83_00760, partial [Flavobacteriales bacterium]|nr:hypothetical protein [Flavobacteriales bacterium]
HKRSNRAAMLYMTALFIFLYITSSWHQWYYGGSFGLRPFIDIYAIMFLPIAFWLREKKGNIRKISLGFMLCSLVLCQIQTYQYRYHIIHWSEMNFETYKQVFLKFP